MRRDFAVKIRVITAKSKQRGGGIAEVFHLDFCLVIHTFNLSLFMADGSSSCSFSEQECHFGLSFPARTK